MINGIGASQGYALGKVWIKKEDDLHIERIEIQNTEEEINRFEAGLKSTKKQLETMQNIALKEIGEEESKIFEAHVAILEDAELVEQTKQMVMNESINVEFAYDTVANQYIEMFNQIEDDYLRERAADLQDVTRRMLRNLMGICDNDIASINEPVIIVAYDLTPSDTVQLDKNNVLGFVTEVGGKTSHAAIMARTMEIPAVLGVKDLFDQVDSHDELVLDGAAGIIHINPDRETKELFKRKKAEFDVHKNSLRELIGKATETKDHYKLELAANIGNPEDLDSALHNDCEGIGLFRSEFLYMNARELPSEESQYQAYSKVAKGLHGKPVVIRTLDIGGDKELSYLTFDKELNPFLGYRAIRMCLENQELFRTQLRALLRASAHGNVKIMFPMISSYQELIEAKVILEHVKDELRDEQISFNESIEVGMMIEVPSAALISDLLAKEVDFFSIGTNDLIQYTTAVDRMNQKISYLYSQYHPAVLRLVKMVVDNAKKEGIWVGMCGEAAGDPKLIPLFVGMGFDELSMSSSSILEARRIIRQMDRTSIKEKIYRVLNYNTAEEIEGALEEL
jgi:phosphotransferase system enzyme I (PtsI)